MGFLPLSAARLTVRYLLHMIGAWRMKRLFIPGIILLTVVPLLTGCLKLSIGGGSSSRPLSPTVGQQLIDLQKAKDAGVISEAEYQTEKANLLRSH